MGHKGMCWWHPSPGREEGYRGAVALFTAHRPSSLVKLPMPCFIDKETAPPRVISHVLRLCSMAQPMAACPCPWTHAACGCLRGSAQARAPDLLHCRHLLDKSPVCLFVVLALRACPAPGKGHSLAQDLEATLVCHLLRQPLTILATMTDTCQALCWLCCLCGCAASLTCVAAACSSGACRLLPLLAFSGASDSSLLRPQHHGQCLAQPGHC